MLKHCLLLWLLVLTGASFAQISITGLVIDAQTNAPLFGAAIKVADQNKGTTTDESGGIRMDGLEPGSVLQISFLGYETRSIRLRATDKHIQVSLLPSSTILSDVTVTAFESERKLLETPAAIARLTANDFERFAMVSPHQAFITLPGVQV